MKEDRLDRSKDIREITKHIPRKFTTNQNDVLLKPVELQEVEEVMSQMSDVKSLGPDGFMLM